MLSTQCAQGLHHRCGFRKTGAGVTCHCKCHVTSVDSPEIRFGDAQLLRAAEETAAQLTQALGFHPLFGGRRLGEMQCSNLTPERQVYLTMPGSYVTVKQAQAISKILKEAE